MLDRKIDPKKRARTAAPQDEARKSDKFGISKSEIHAYRVRTCFSANKDEHLARTSREFCLSCGTFQMIAGKYGYLPEVSHFFREVCHRNFAKFFRTRQKKKGSRSSRFGMQSKACVQSPERLGNLLQNMYLAPQLAAQICAVEQNA